MTDDQLSALLDSLGESTSNLSRLRKQMSTPLGIIPFVGAGLSIPFGFRGWDAFLLDQAQKARIEVTIQANIEVGEYEQAGEAVLTARGHRAFLNAIDSEFGDKKLEGQQLANAVGVLPRIAHGPVITTNFDHVLERVFETAGERFERVVWGAKATSVYDALTKDSHFLLKLHGDVDEQDDRVLTHADYEKYYGPGSLLRQVLRNLFIARPILFLGCSLVPDRWVQLLEDVAWTNTAMEHFALVEYPATDDEYVRRQQFLSNHGISPIWFPHTRFDLIEAILTSLAPTPVPPMPLQSHNRLITGADDGLLRHTTGFFGRADEVRAVLQFLHEADAPRVATVSPVARILFVTGAAGTGKSEVCKEALQQLLRDQPTAHTYYVELVDVRDAMGVLAHLVDAFDMPRATPDRVWSAIAAEPCLLYLDNAEDMLGDQDAVATLRRLVDMPGVRVLASSRERVAQFGRDLPIHELDLVAAETLFAGEWNRSAPDRPLTDSPELHEFLCTDLDCHALSIVLVAAQAYQAASLDEIVTRWKQEATRLARLLHGDDRLTSLAVSLERSLSSVQDKSADAVTLWGLCALFPEGMSPAAFDAVTTAFANQRFEAREVLLRLSIIRFSQPRESENRSVGSPRDETTVQMLAPLRRFILKRAQEGAVGLNIDDLLAPALAYFSRLATIARQTELHDDGTARGEALDRLLPELPNLREAVVLAAQRGTQWVEPLGALSHELSNSYQFRGLVSVEILHALLTLQQQAHRTVEAADTLGYLANLERCLGDIDHAREHYGQAMKLYTQEHASLGLANMLTSVGDLERCLGDIDHAREHYGQAMKLYTQKRDNHGLANVLTSLGLLENQLGEIDPARKHFTKAMKLYTQTRDNLGLANALKSLGDLESLLEEIDHAREHYGQAIELYTQTRDNLGLANALRSLGDLESHLEEIDHAREHYGQAIELYTQERHNLGLANALRSLGDLERRLGEIDHAREHYGQAIELYTQERDNLGLANALTSLGGLELTLDEFQQAGVDYTKARELYAAEREMMGLGYTWAELARVAHALNQPEQADRCLDEAMRAAQASNVPSVVQYVVRAKTEIHPNATKHDEEPEA